MRLRSAKMRYRRRYLLIPVLFVMIVPTVIVWTNTANRPSPLNEKRAASPVSPQCRKGDPLTGVYNPLRFRVLSSCETGKGIVNSITIQADRSTWIHVTIDQQYSKLLGLGNNSHQDGQLVLEEVSGDQPSTPSIGERISFVGPLAYDTYGDFNAIVPVWSITQA